MTAQNEPKLAAPGAGLPMFELLVWRLLFALRRQTGSRRSFGNHFQKEQKLIAELAHAGDAESGTHRILIRRTYGLEDSSRYWSVWMTLDHLRIVHHEFIRIIKSLTNDIIPSGEASTAAVKPSSAVTAAVAVAYEESCEKLFAIVAAPLSLKTSAYFSHPWFGPLDAVGWYALAGIHMHIHRVQIERILKELSRSKKCISI